LQVPDLFRNLLLGLVSSHLCCRIRCGNCCVQIAKLLMLRVVCCWEGKRLDII